jgi:DNA polymerase-3 subunit epsilon
MDELKRQLVLDTETTGLEPSQGHRIIEIGVVEMIDRRLTGNNFHIYLQPDREIDAGAIEVHGITNEFLTDKPRFEDIAEELADYLRGAEVIIHNAPFDVGFIDAEYQRMENGLTMESLCEVIDTLVMAREMHPGQRNSLDALCSRYDVENKHRTKHGALLDSEILADVYLAMTGGQKSLGWEADDDTEGDSNNKGVRRVNREGLSLRVLKANADELAAHEERLDAIASSGTSPVWRQDALTD